MHLTLFDRDPKQKGNRKRQDQADDQRQYRDPRKICQRLEKRLLIGEEYTMQKPHESGFFSECGKYPGRCFRMRLNELT